MRPGSSSSASWSRSPRSPTARSPLPQPERRRSTRSSSHLPATTARQGRHTAASAAPAGCPPPSPRARSTPGAGAQRATCSCSPGFARSSRVSSRSVVSSRPRCRFPRRSWRCPHDSGRRRRRRWLHAPLRPRRLQPRRRAPRCCCRGEPLRPRPCVRSLPRVRARCSSTARCRPGRSAPTGRSRCRSSGCLRPTRMPCALALRGSIPVTLAVGAAAFDTNDGLGAAAPFSSEGLAFDGGPKPEVSAAGHRARDLRPGPRRGRRRALRHAQRLERGGRAHRRGRRAARPGAARPRRSRLEAGARCLGETRGRGRGRRRSTRRQRVAVELVADPPAVGLGAALAENTTVRRRVTLRNVSRRTLELTIEPGTADAADIVVEVVPQVAKLRPGSVAAGLGRGDGAAAADALRRRSAARLRVKVSGGTTLQIPWTIAVPPAKRDLIPSARLSCRTFVPSDVDPRC